MADLRRSMASVYSANENALIITRASVARRRQRGQTRLDMTILPDSPKPEGEARWRTPEDLANLIIADVKRGWLQNQTGVKLKEIKIETRRPTGAPSTAAPTKLFADFADLSGQEKGILGGASVGGLVLIGRSARCSCALRALHSSFALALPSQRRVVARATSRRVLGPRSRRAGSEWFAVWHVVGSCALCEIGRPSGCC